MSPRTLVALLTAVLTVSPAAADDRKPQLPGLNRKIVQFCVDNLGKKVGDGECLTLAYKAVQHAGAKAHSDFPVPKPPLQKDDWAWGRLLGPEDEVLPGDIIQFRDVEIKVQMPNFSYQWSFPHHTAIVLEVQEKGKYVVLHQNVGSGDRTEEQRRVVQKEMLPLGARTRGSV